MSWWLFFCWLLASIVAVQSKFYLIDTVERKPESHGPMKIPAKGSDYADDPAKKADYRFVDPEAMLKLELENELKKQMSTENSSLALNSTESTAEPLQLPTNRTGLTTRQMGKSSTSSQIKGTPKEVVTEEASPKPEDQNGNKSSSDSTSTPWGQLILGAGKRNWEGAKSVCPENYAKLMGAFNQEINVFIAEHYPFPLWMSGTKVAGNETWFWVDRNKKYPMKWINWDNSSRIDKSGNNISDRNISRDIGRDYSVTVIYTGSDYKVITNKDKSNVSNSKNSSKPINKNKIKANESTSDSEEKHIYTPLDIVRRKHPKTDNHTISDSHTISKNNSNSGKHKKSLDNKDNHTTSDSTIRKNNTISGKHKKSPDNKGKYNRTINPSRNITRNITKLHGKNTNKGKRGGNHGRNNTRITISGKTTDIPLKRGKRNTTKKNRGGKDSRSSGKNLKGRDSESSPDSQCLLINPEGKPPGSWAMADCNEEHQFLCGVYGKPML